MTQVETEVTAVREAQPPSPRGRWRRTLVLVVAAVALVAGGVVAYETALFGGGGSGGGTADNTSATSLATVIRRSLSQQTQVSATLGYAAPVHDRGAGGDGAVGPAAGAAGGDDGAGAAADARRRRSRPTARRSTRRARGWRRRGRSWRSTAAARTPARAPRPAGAAARERRRLAPCATDSQAVSTDEQSATQAAAKVASRPEPGLVARRRRSRRAERACRRTEASAARLRPELDLHRAARRSGRSSRGAQTCTRSAASRSSCSTDRSPRGGRSCPGCQPGKDVAELNANLRALGYGPALSGDAFTRRRRRRSTRSRPHTGSTGPGSCCSARSCSSPGRCG